MTGGDHGDDGEDVNSLLNAIRMAARREDEETNNLPADATPALSDGARARIVEAILRAQTAEHRPRTEPDPVTDDDENDALALRRKAQAPAGGARRRSNQRIWGMAAGGLAVVLAAAAAFVMWMRPASQTGSQEASQGGSLPAYFVSASGGVADLRGGKSESAEADGATTASVQRLRPESELRVICRPDNAITGPLAVRAFFVQGDNAGEVTPLVQLAPTGAAELRLRGSDLLPRYRGRGTLRVVVGRPADIRAVVPQVAVAGSGDSSGSPARNDGRRWLTVPLELVDLP